MRKNWLNQEPTQLGLRFKVKPGSRQNSLSFDAEGGLQVSLQAPAQDGKANKMLIDYLARVLGLTKKQLVLTHGTSARIKILQIKIPLAEQQKIIEQIIGLAGDI